MNAAGRSHESKTTKLNKNSILNIKILCHSTSQFVYFIQNCSTKTLFNMRLYMFLWYESWGHAKKKKVSDKCHITIFRDCFHAAVGF